MCMQGTEDNVDATFANAIRKKSTMFLKRSFPITSLTFLTGRELPRGHIRGQESLTRYWNCKVLKVTWHLLYPRVFKSVLSAEYTLKVGQFYLLWFELFTIFPSQWLVNNQKCHFIRIIINDCKFDNSSFVNINSIKRHSKLRFDSGVPIRPRIHTLFIVYD